MTIEEYIGKNHGYGKTPVDASKVTFNGFGSNPSHVYSEYTSEDFSCYLNYEVGGRKFNYILLEYQIADFLNTMFPATEY